MANNNLENQQKTILLKIKNFFIGLAYSYVKNIDDALDVVQESIYKAFHLVDSLKRFWLYKTWFYRIIVNVSLDLLRKRKRGNYN